MYHVSLLLEVYVLQSLLNKKKCDSAAIDSARIYRHFTDQKYINKQCFFINI